MDLLLLKAQPAYHSRQPCWRSFWGSLHLPRFRRSKSDPSGPVVLLFSEGQFVVAVLAFVCPALRLSLSR